MNFTIKTTAFILAAIALAAPATNSTLNTANTIIDASIYSSTVTPKTEGWAQLCSDANCSENCGISVAIDNPDCLGQVGRKSVKLHGLFAFGAKALVGSPGETCDCESSCIDGILGEQERCINLEEYPAHSFRFTKGSCPEMTC
ncbi:hypothetical protein SI65_05647 [Aspergillus cristatus]|uniref:Uncharacterized protein n=1 Tax=Aspergillus cristatus TaxID=573508 RepID=A0A1E3BDI2_ASPCR|nr:hypothetical protein SI65_05647 [Aspergillus cristatus]